MNQPTETFKQDKGIDLLIGERFRPLRHAVFLLALFLLFFATKLQDIPSTIKYGHLIVFYFGFVAMFYFNMYVLVPRFLFKTQYFKYFLLLVLIVVSTLESLSFIVEHYLSILGPDGKHEIEQNQDDRIGPYVGNFLAITLILLSTTFKLFVRWMKDKERINELNNLTLRMELNELRNQINPHFLFNMLNNVKALIRIDAEKATVVIMKLSEFLRYQLYENNEGKTSLHSELQFLSNLAELEKIRRDNLTFTMNAEIPKDRLSHILLPPNLFTTFLENAIKYSVDINGKPETIEIYLSVKDQTLCFKCCNSKGVDIWPTDAKSNGLGLANIQRRLELLYADLFKLDISSTPTAFSVNLIIPI